MSKDTIYREDAIEVLAINAPFMSDEAYLKSYDALKSIPSADRPKGEWIPCSERLPEEETECLVTDSYGGIRHCVKDKCGNNEFATYEEYMHIDAIAWMPLPKAYEESEK